MNIAADLHTHTHVSDHAYCTLSEMCKAAKQKGLQAIGITNHGPAIPDGVHIWHFMSYQYFIPRVVDGVIILKGAECNIQNPDGRLDIQEDVLDKLDIVIASIHKEVCLDREFDVITKMMLNVVENPHVDILGHPGSPLYGFDYEKVISLCNQNRKIVEINGHSFSSRKGSEENCMEIAQLCKEYEVPVAVNSDAHSSFTVGDVGQALKVLEKVNFPDELVINAHMNRLNEYLLQKKGIDLLH